MNTNTTHYHIHDGELLCTCNGKTSVFMSRDLRLTPGRLRAWRDTQNLRVRAVRSGKHQPACNISRYRHVRDGEPESGLRYCTCRTFPRPTRRPRPFVELTPAGLNTAHKNASRAVSAALDAYSDAGASIQEGGKISPATWNALGSDLDRATRLQAACCTLTHGAK